MTKYLCLILSFLILMSTVSFVSASEASSDFEEGKYVYRNNTFDFGIIDEDPMRITDEEFFGAYDKDGNEITPSYFKYDEYPGMAAVKEAAMQGDYEAAKEALYEYYLPMKYELIAPKTSLSAQDLLQCEMQARNVYSAVHTGLPIDITGFVGTEWTTVDVNTSVLLEYINSITTASATEVGIVIASVDKSNTPAEIMSIDTDSPATLNLVVNNVQKTYTVVADSYISPVKNANTNYGNEPILYAQEYGYDGFWYSPTGGSTFAWGEEASETKRAYLKFDLEDIKATDTISSATLSFKARTAPGGDLTEKELFIYGWGDTSWTESNLTWNSFSDWLFLTLNDKEVWDHLTPDNTSLKGKICYYHRGTLTKKPADAYDYTGDEKYAYTTMRNVMSMMYHCGDNLDVMNQLDFAGNIKTVGNAFIYCWGSEVMTPTMFTACMKNFHLIAEQLVTILDKELIANNVATSMSGSLFKFVRSYPEFKRAEHWHERVLYHNRRLYEHSAFEDGSCVEQSVSYVQVYIASVFESATFLDTVKREDYSTFCDDEAMGMLYRIVADWQYSMAPGFKAHHMGDAADYGASYQASLKTYYNKFVKMGIDPVELEYAATNGESGTIPFTSISYPVAKRTFMRSDWSDKAVYLVFNGKGDSARATHGHNDVLNVNMYAYGRQLISDPGYGSVLTGEIFAYMKHAEQHNTVTVNGGNIATAGGQDGVEKEMELNDIYNMATYTHAYVDNAANSERTVMYPKNAGFFIISDYIEPSDDTIVNTYTQFWQMMPSANISISQDGKNEFRSNYESGANVIVSPVDSESMSDIRLGDTLYAPSSGKFVETKKGVYERKSKGAVKYNTILYPYETGDEREIETTPIDVGVENEGASAFRIKVINPKDGSSEIYYYYHLSDLEQRKPVTIGKYTTDATAILVQEDLSGKATSFFIYDGSYIEQSNIKDKYLFKSNDGNVTLGTSIDQGNFVEISSDSIDAQKLENITIYTGFNVSSASFNGDRIVDSEKDGAYIYFGEEPIVNCTEEAPENSETEDDFEDFVGGGGSSSGGSGGGFGGSGATTPDNTEDKDDENTDVPVTEPEKPVISYDDVKEDDWYYDYVVELSEKGILSGDGTGNFAPNIKITREQFLKMLIIAADVQTEEAENTFTDVLNHAWYKEYVLKAKTLGIVNGVSDTKFGVGSNITRQDMAVMIARVMEKLGVETEKTETARFADDDKISDYAKESVMLMKSIGLIEGYNNEFRPMDTLTRAESAKVITCLLKIIK